MLGLNRTGKGWFAQHQDNMTEWDIGGLFSQVGAPPDMTLDLLVGI